MGKPGLENQEDSILKKNTSWLFWTLRSQLQGTERIVISTYTLEKPKAFDCDLVEDMKPVVAVRDDFACQDK